LAAELNRFPFIKPALVFLLLALAWDASGLDLAVMQQWGSPGGFPLKDQPLWSLWLHERGKQLALLAAMLLLLMVWRPIGPWRQVSRPARLASALAVLASVLTVSLLKRHSLTSCPWDLQIFGGAARYVSHWSWGVADGGHAGCFPGGHAAGALGLMPASLPFLQAQEKALRRFGLALFALALLSGLLFGLVQTVRGAHYPSHTLWTACICWCAGWLSFQGLLRPAQRLV